MSLMELGSGQFFITSVLACPGFIPSDLHILYPKYVILAVPIEHLLGFFSILLTHEGSHREI